MTAGGLEALVALVRESSPVGRAEAAAALCNLSYDHSASIAVAGGLEALVELVRDGSPEGKAAAAEALCHLEVLQMRHPVTATCTPPPSLRYLGRQSGGSGGDGRSGRSVDATTWPIVGLTR